MRSTEARRPLQERGQRRVEAILDAAAEMVAERGIAGVTMHGIATRSGATIGSMYHFFPDQVSVLDALAARHQASLRALLERLGHTRWSALSTREAVDRFVDPLFDYNESHPDLLSVIRYVRERGTECCDAQIERLMLELAERVVAECQPRATAAERAARGATMLAVIDGVAERTSQVPTPPHRTMIRELKRVLVAYLESGARDGARRR
ncbi:MAG TPA: TetR/AcrR family transcriptional regulator [Gemmatimonadaceae bacterium]